MIKKSYKFRIYPSKKQLKKLEKGLDQACFLYNNLLDIKMQVYAGIEENLSQFDLNNLCKEFPLENLHSQVKQNIPKRISDAFNYFFRRVKEKKGKVGYPKFKKRIFYKSLTFPQSGFELYSDTRLYASKIGMIRIIKHRDIEGKIKTLTIKKENNGEWYAVFSCEGCPTQEYQMQFESEVEGLDVGIKNFLVCSNRESHDNPKHLKKSEQKLKKLQRRLSRKKKGGKNRKKAIIKLAKQHLHVKKQREDFHKKLARSIAMKIKYIGIEDLHIKGMGGNHHLAKSISDCGWSSFFNYLKYFKEQFGGEVIKIGRFSPTSQTCSQCGNIQNMPLKIRTFECESCGNKRDRDFNSSINIRNEVILKLKQKNIKLNNTAGQVEIHAFGDNVRPLQKAVVVELGTRCSIPS